MTAAALLERSVLVLNRYWLAVHICNARRALCLLYVNLARVVDEDYRTYDFDSWRELSAAAEGNGNVIHTPQFRLLVPEVIVLTRYARRPPHQVKFSRRNIYERDNYTCQYCGAKPSRDDLTIDHIVPRSRGGRSTWENVVLACTRCNIRKGDRLPEECGMKVRRHPTRPHWTQIVSRSRPIQGHTLWQQFIDSAYWNVMLEE